MPQFVALLASTVTADGARVISVSDRAAVALALDCGSECVAGHLPGDRWAAEYALAAGMPCAQVVSNEWPNEFDLVFVGGGFLEHVGDAYAAKLAEPCGAVLLFDVLKCTRRSKREWTLLRDAGRGARDVIAVTGPAVIVVSSSVPCPPYVSRSRRQRARSAASPTSSLTPHASSRSAIDWQPARPRTRRANTTAANAAADHRMDSAFGVMAASPAAKNEPIVADPLTCARHLVRYLAHHGFLQVEVEHTALPTSVGKSTTSVQLEQGPTFAVRLDSASTARRPRKPGEALNRRQRQPRPRTESQSVTTRRPRRLSGPPLADRGPRRVGVLDPLR